MVMIESLATGTPVIATPRGSVPEIVDDGQTGFLRTNQEQLGAALQWAWSLSRLQCRVVETGRNRASDPYSDQWGYPCRDSYGGRWFR